MGTVLSPSSVVRMLSAVFFYTLAATHGQAGTLEDVRSTGVLQCGVDGVADGFSARKVDGVWSGLPVDFCRALALATVGDASKVNFTLLAATERVEALQSGEVDVLVSALPISAEFESRDGLLFTARLFYNSDADEIYGAAVRQGDDQWFVVTRWLQDILTKNSQAKDLRCEDYDAVNILRKNWGCDVIAAFGKSAWQPQQN